VSIFACPRCGTRENTATCRHGYWRRAGLVPLCSACDPGGSGWHGKFEQQPAQPDDDLHTFGGLAEAPYDPRRYADHDGRPVELYEPPAAPPATAP
jgi:hypothetical protein